jgi:GxxExxY protein
MGGCITFYLFAGLREGWHADDTDKYGSSLIKTKSMTLINSDLTEMVIKAFYSVYNELGYGFLERVYQNAMLIELRKQGLECVGQQMITVNYNGIVVGDYFADIVVDNSVILELKAVECLIREHELQLINYLKATDMEVGLLLNFGNKPEFRRKVFLNERKSR